MFFTFHRMGGLVGSNILNYIRHFNFLCGKVNEGKGAIFFEAFLYSPLPTGSIFCPTLWSSLMPLVRFRDYNPLPWFHDATQLHDLGKISSGYHPGAAAVQSFDPAIIATKESRGKFESLQAPFTGAKWASFCAAGPRRLGRTSFGARNYDAQLNVSLRPPASRKSSLHQPLEK
jgi:hypothetical protein